VLDKVFRYIRDSVIIFILTFALLEGSLRLYHYISPSFIFPDNSENRFRGKPFASNFGFTLNSRGFHDTEFQQDKTPGSIRIVGIGDSFVFSVVPYEYNFLTLLEDNMNAPSDRRFEILNMGVPSTSPREYFSVLVKEALPLKPDAALICIFVGNDFIEISPKPVLHRSFVISAAKYVIDSFRYVEANVQANNVYSYRSQYDDEAPTFSDAYFLEIEAMRTEVYDQSNAMLSERLPRVMAWIDEIKTACENNGIQLFVMLIPDELQVNTALQERVLEKLGADKDKLDFDRPNKRLGEELRARNIKYLDLLEPFRLRSRDVRLYKPRDTHWNIAGNRLAADLLHNFLHEAIDERRGS
jgi:SGNH hydrolase-like domain, acetyltransferase AlgX